VGTEVLLEVQEGNLHVSRGVKKIAELLVENEYATVVGVLEAVLLDVGVDGAGYEAARHELTLLETEELPKLIRDLLLTVEPVVLGAVGRLLPVGIFLLSLDLSDNLGQRLKLITEGGNLGKDGFNSRHCTLYTCQTFKYLVS
jgi:hypothetical protein